jgi:peptidoglycan/xylan/chitin deacetylase (PgdA/CDA1 family)
MEALASDEEIDQQYQQSIEVVREKLGITSISPSNLLPISSTPSTSPSRPPLTPMFSPLASLFRPPYGTLGARTRQSLGRNIPQNPTIVMWSIDVEDWKWGASPTPERQMEAFKRGVERGGDLVVLHYLYPSTVGLLREMVRWVRDGEDGGGERRIGTVGECLGG